ncbi:hypothetical protein HNY73_010001 [Argiope bruennichi]|uniref:Uncharacterized protein n=1 Tax=Argiope bruennichi TaxID=94029 RepID=A0A8T0F1T8_ARGBR|nr:hypothetical protein HNY73_010001 [Argiope bruennichi]
MESSSQSVSLAASIRGDVADVLETLTERQRHDFQALLSALELRCGEKCTKEYSRLQLKSRYQKAGESLQELAADIQRLSHLAFSDCPVETRQDLALQHFIDSVQDPETQKALRLADVKDKGSALVFAHKIEAAQQATRKDRHPIRAVFAADSDSDFVKQIDNLRREIRRLKELKDGGIHLAGRRCPDSQKPHFKVFHISSISGGDNGLYVIGQIGNISCRMVVDTEANVREDLA